MGTMRRYALVVMALLAATAATPALAQTAPSSPPTRPPEVTPLPADPKACAPGERLQRQQDDGQPKAPATSGQNLGEKLSRTEGVLCPPPTGDTEMNVPPPGGGRTPVIPPPGTPGGDPSVRPK